MRCVICLSDNDNKPIQSICSNDHTLHIECYNKMLFTGHYKCPICKENIEPIHRYNLRASEKRYKELINTDYHIEDEIEMIDTFKEKLILFKYIQDNREYFMALFEVFRIFQDNIEKLKDIERLYLKMMNIFTSQCFTNKMIFDKEDIEYKYSDYILSNLLKV